MPSKYAIDAVQAIVNGRYDEAADALDRLAAYEATRPCVDPISPSVDLRARVAAIGKGIYGGNSDPNRCVCAEKETGHYAGTPHRHYEEPPFACARCACSAYAPAVSPPAPVEVPGEAVERSELGARYVARAAARLTAQTWNTRASAADAISDACITAALPHLRAALLREARAKVYALHETIKVDDPLEAGIHCGLAMAQSALSAPPTAPASAPTQPKEKP